MYKYLIFVFIIVLIAGCAVYPTTRTYFEPNHEDGTPTRSSSCGYHRAANDSLKRDMGNFTISVSPYYKKEENLSVVVSLRYEEGNIEILKDEILVVVNKKDSYFPENININRYSKDNTHANRVFIHLIYPVLSESISNLEVKLPNITTNKIKSFRFKKTTKSDIYYASINC